MKDYSGFPNKITLETTLLSSDEYPGSAFFQFDFDFPAVFGTNGKVPVWLSVDGHRYRSTIAVYGGVHLMVFNATMRKETGYQAGDTIQITLERDTEIRKITLPEDIRSWLENAGVAEVYDNYSYSHQKEVLDWINDTKNPETRKRRIAKLAEKLSSEKKQ